MFCLRLIAVDTVWEFLTADGTSDERRWGWDFGDGEGFTSKAQRLKGAGGMVLCAVLCVLCS